MSLTVFVWRKNLIPQPGNYQEFALKINKTMTVFIKFSIPQTFEETNYTTVFIRIEVPSRIEVPPVFEGNKLNNFSSLKFIESHFVT